MNGMFKKQVKCLDCGFLGTHDAMPTDMPFFEAPPSLDERLKRRKLLKDLGMLEPHECTQQQRNHIAAGNYEDRIQSPFTLLCTRRVWNEWDLGEEAEEIEEALARVLHSDRKCRLFQRYEAGYSPTEHKELQREDRNRRILLVGMLLAALIGAGAAIIAQVFAA